MSEISKVYEPKQVERRWYDSWIQSGCFNGEAQAERESYCIVIPPPNVTGVLTMGHVLNNTIQDMLVRRARQQGKAARWIPGTDHAGIATQSRVEKFLKQNEGVSRHDLGREKFLAKAVEWRDKHGGIIIEQLKRLGCSCDWERNVHTLDNGYSRAVLTAFVELYQRGYIYRGKRMVNWCPVSLTALSDEEVVMKPQKGKLYKMRYEIVEYPGQFVQISTTRPETLMGDTAVAVHPEDERYQHLIGKHVWRPFPREAIPIIADSHVEKEFGTGVLKVTPAHDPADFEIGKRHNLPVIDVLNPDGTLNKLAGDEFAGMDRFAARKAAAKKLETLGLLISAEDYENNVGFSERADVPIEPRLSEQWFLKYPRIAEAKAAVRDGHIKFYPERWEKTYLHWLENIQDWCISRQLWWGHRIPVWYRKGVNRTELDCANPAHIHVSLEGPSDPENWEQDADVLDTWASSWLWPLATMGWPDETAMKQQALHYFYPTSALVTGPDIIFFWVARMIIAGLEFYGERKPASVTLTPEEIAQRIPFKDVFFTGIIRDLQGRKMSKSLGNSPDPLDLIAEYGADGLRYGIMSIAPQGQDIRFAEDRVEQGRNFCNKLWNACRFRQISGIQGENTSVSAICSRLNASKLDADDHAMIARLCTLTETVNTAFDAYEFSQCVQLIYAFFWNDFCDWYVEVSKSRLQDESAKGTILAIQDLCIRQVLLLLHPLTPFITEELWHGLGFGEAGSFIQNKAPETSTSLLATLESTAGVRLDAGAVADIDRLRDFVTQARALKSQYNLASRRDVQLFFKGETTAWNCISTNTDKLKKLIGASAIVLREDAVDGAPGSVTQLGTLYLDLASAVDVVAERIRISKEIEKLEKVITSSEARLKNPGFADKAPAEVVEGARVQLEENKNKLIELKKLFAGLTTNDPSCPSSVRHG